MHGIARLIGNSAVQSQPPIHQTNQLIFISWTDQANEMVEICLEQLSLITDNNLNTRGIKSIRKLRNSSRHSLISCQPTNYQIRSTHAGPQVYGKLICFDPYREARWIN